MEKVLDIAGANFAVVGIVKDSADTLQGDVLRISKSLERAKSLKWLIIESNSTDNTVDVLHDLSKVILNFDFKSLSQKSKPQNLRTVTLAEARNVYLSEIKNDVKYIDVDYVIVMDFNGLNNRISKESIESCFKYDFWDVCTANQNGPYYDIWALRHNLWSPNDCWETHTFFRQYMKSPEKALFASLHSRMITISPDANWIEVDSAFGGMAIYKKNVFIVGSYSGLNESGFPICEHVTFHNRIKKNNYKIYINPRLINTNKTDHSEQYSNMAKLKRKLLYPIKFLRFTSPNE